LKEDPPIPDHGGCAVCGKPRKPILGVSGRKGEVQKIEQERLRDPFCTAKCARAYHEIDEGTLGRPEGTNAAASLERLNEAATDRRRLRQEISNRRLAKIKHAPTSACLWCEEDLPAEDAQGRASRKRFCCEDHRRRWNARFGGKVAA